MCGSFNSKYNICVLFSLKQVILKVFVNNYKEYDDVYYYWDFLERKKNPISNMISPTCELNQIGTISIVKG